MPAKYRLPAVVTILIMMLIFNTSCNNVGSDVQVYTSEESQKILEEYIVEDADGIHLKYCEADFKLEPKGNKFVPSAIAVKKAIAENGFYNKELFDTLKIYILPYRVPSIIDDLYDVNGFVADLDIVLFAGGDQEDLQQLVLHELGHIAYQKANQAELDDYINWRLAGVKSTFKKYEIAGEIVIKQDSYAKYVLEPEEVVAEDFSIVYSKSPGQPQYENYLDSPLSDPKLKAEIKKRLDKLFENQK